MIELVSKTVAKKRGCKKKFGEKEITQILKYKEYPNKKDIITILADQCNIKIGYGTLTKILDGGY